MDDTCVMFTNESPAVNTGLCFTGLDVFVVADATAVDVVVDNKRALDLWVDSLLVDRLECFGFVLNIPQLLTKQSRNHNEFFYNKHAGVSQKRSGVFSTGSRDANRRGKIKLETRDLYCSSVISSYGICLYAPLGKRGKNDIPLSWY